MEQTYVSSFYKINYKNMTSKFILPQCKKILNIAVIIAEKDFYNLAFKI
jgi:hypothetical protein